MKRAIFCQWMTSPNASGKPFHKCYCPAEFQVTDKGVKVGKVCMNHAVEAHNIGWDIQRLKSKRTPHGVDMAAT